jgi:hypothetical protein
MSSSCFDKSATTAHLHGAPAPAETSRSASSTGCGGGGGASRTVSGRGGVPAAGPRDKAEQTRGTTAAAAAPVHQQAFSPVQRFIIPGEASLPAFHDTYTISRGKLTA